MSYEEWHCRGCGERMGFAGELSDDPEVRDREIADYDAAGELWDERHAACDPLRPVRWGIVSALIRDDASEVRRLRAALRQVERTAREAVVA